MTGRIKTLILDANGFGWKAVTADTLLQGLLGIRDVHAVPGWVRKVRLLDRALDWHYDRLSYVMDWREELERSEKLDAEVCNINNLINLRQAQKAVAEYPLVIILHSAAGDSMSLLMKTIRWFQKRRGRVVMFIGNEYDLLDQKINFIRSTGVDYVCSQLPGQAARWLYRDCTESKILTMAHALNPRLYHPSGSQSRSVELGFRGARYPAFIGDSERNDLLDFFETKAASLGLQTDFIYRNIRRTEWADFLRDCRGVLGAEAGTYYLDRFGASITAARLFQRQNPGVASPEIYRRFFENLTDFVSGKSISSRHFEPVGTKTCQLLLDGEYNGILKADEHYIRIKKDMSNVHDVVLKLKDVEYRNQITERAFAYVSENHTYAHRIAHLLRILEEDGP